MRSPGRFAVVVALACTVACGDGSLDDDYEVIEIRLQTSGCDGPGELQTILEPERWFRLEELSLDGATLLGFFACSSPGVCDEQANLALSFGRVSGDWVTSTATALDGGTCTLRFRERTLVNNGGELRIEEHLYEDTDDTLTGPTCDNARARERGRSMPCIEHETRLAVPMD